MKLSPCYKCGSEPRINRLYRDQWEIRCNKIGCINETDWHKTRKEAIKEWELLQSVIK